MWHVGRWICVLTVLRLGGTSGLCRPTMLFRPSPYNMLGLICSRCCGTTWILCRTFPPAVAPLCAFSSSLPSLSLPDMLGSGQALGQGLLWCHSDVTGGWGGGGQTSQIDESWELWGAEWASTTDTHTLQKVASTHCFHSLTHSLL